MSTQENQEYQYQLIKNTYTSALEKAANKLGLDSHTKTLETESIDSKVINGEISLIHIAARQLVVNCIKTNNESELEKIGKYVSSLESPTPINKYYNDNSPNKHSNVQNLSGHTVLDDLYNAFNHGLVQSYKFNVLKEQSALYNMYGSGRVKINFKAPEI